MLAEKDCVIKAIPTQPVVMVSCLLSRTSSNVVGSCSVVCCRACLHVCVFVLWLCLVLSLCVCWFLVVVCCCPVIDAYVWHCLLHFVLMCCQVLCVLRVTCILVCVIVRAHLSGWSLCLFSSGLVRIVMFVNVVSLGHGVLWKCLVLSLLPSRLTWNPRATGL